MYTYAGVLWEGKTDGSMRTSNLESIKRKGEEEEEKDGTGSGENMLDLIPFKLACCGT